MEGSDEIAGRGRGPVINKRYPVSNNSNHNGRILGQLGQGTIARKREIWKSDEGVSVFRKGGVVSRPIPILGLSMLAVSQPQSAPRVNGNNGPNRTDSGACVHVYGMLWVESLGRGMR